MNLDSYGLSVKGPTRLNNEDSILLIPEESLFILADGMGGHQGGAEASRLTVNLIKSYLQHSISLSDEPFDILLRSAIKFVNAKIFNPQAQNSHHDRMGATLNMLWFFGDIVLIGNVGDSRCYRLRNGKLKQLSIDHTLWEGIKGSRYGIKCKGMGVLSSTLTRVMGTQKDVEPDIGLERILPGDVYLSCSDGLTGELNDSEIEEILKSQPTAEAACRMLVETAETRMARDNVSVIVTRVKEVSKHSAARFSSSAGPIKKPFSMFSVVALVLLVALLLGLLFFKGSSPPANTSSEAIGALIDGKYLEAVNLFSTAIDECEEIGPNRLHYRLGRLYSMWNLQRTAFTMEEIRKEVNETLIEAEYVGSDLSQGKYWPMSPTTGLLKFIRGVALERWNDILVAGILVKVKRISDPDTRLKLSIRIDEAKDLYVTYLKVGDSKNLLEKIRKDIVR